MWQVIKKDKLLVVHFILFTVQMTNNKSVTQKWTRYSSKWTFQNLTVPLNAIRNPCATMACCSSELIFAFVYAGSSNPSRVYTLLSQISFSIQTPQTANLRIRSEGTNNLLNQTHVRMNSVSLTITNTIPQTMHWLLHVRGVIDK